MSYLYNGVELPDIDTVWTDKEAYPYALIGMGSTGNCTLYISDATGTYGKPSARFIFDAGTYENPYTLIRYTCQVGGTEWKWESQGNTSALGIPFWVESYEPVWWSSYDTFNNEGELYLAASEPVPGGGNPVPGDKELYLYNGVRFPAMPEWDENTYPYAYIVSSNIGNGIWFTATNKALVATKQTDGLMVVYTPGSGVGYIEWLYLNGSWMNEFESTTGQRYYKSQYWEVVWSNHDIKNSDDGAIYLAASEPIPVVTEPQDPTSCLNGWLVGRAVASQRGKA